MLNFWTFVNNVPFTYLYIKVFIHRIFIIFAKTYFQHLLVFCSSIISRAYSLMSCVSIQGLNGKLTLIAFPFPNRPGFLIRSKYDSVDDYSSNSILIHFIRLNLLTFRFELSLRKQNSI